MIRVTIRITDQLSSTTPELLSNAARALAKHSQFEMANALREPICATCDGEGIIGIRCRRNCPDCNGTGWVDGEDQGTEE